MTTETISAPKDAMQGNGSRVAHIAASENAGHRRVALCGARLGGPVGAGSGRCVVCLEMASYGRFACR